MKALRPDRPIDAMKRTYRAVGQVSVLTGVSCFGLIVLASLDFVGSMRVACVSLWPFVVLILVASVFVASWAFAKAKGRSGWLGILLPFLDVIGLKVLFKLEDRAACRQRHEAIGTLAMKHASRLLIASALGAPAAALAINVCTDAGGKTVYQQQPCLSLAPHQENAPVTATTITSLVATETIRRFRASLSNRDATTAANLLAPNFTASIQNTKGTVQYDRAAFADMLTRVLNAATAYKSAAHCSAPVIAGATATVACEVRESLTLLKRSSDSASSDTHKIALVDGAVKLVSIVSVQREK